MKPRTFTDAETAVLCRAIAAARKAKGLLRPPVRHDLAAGETFRDDAGLPTDVARREAADRRAILTGAALALALCLLAGLLWLASH